jgi:hypothetical protein
MRCVAWVEGKLQLQYVTHKSKEYYHEMLDTCIDPLWIEILLIAQWPTHIVTYLTVP